MPKIISETLGYGDRINRERATNIKAAHAEEALLGMMLIYPEYAKKVKSGEVELGADDFVTDFNRRVFETMISDDGGTDIGILAQSFSFDEIARIEGMAEKRAELSDNGDAAFSGYVAALKSEKKPEGTDDIGATLAILEKKKQK